MLFFKNHINTKDSLKEKHEILELKEKLKNKKKKLRQGLFSKITIIFCILFISIFSLLCLYIQYKTGADTHFLLQIVATVFGGELLMLLFKRIWASEDRPNIKINSKKQNNNKKINETEGDTGGRG